MASCFKMNTVNLYTKVGFLTSRELNSTKPVS